MDKHAQRPPDEAFSELSDDALLDRLLSIQRDLRQILVEYKIGSGSLSGMAHQARKSISNAEVRADFLELLIHLQELGAIAKRRRILAEADMTGAGDLSRQASRATAKRHGGGEAKKPAATEPTATEPAAGARPRDARDSDRDQRASDDFFKGLD